MMDSWGGICLSEWTSYVGRGVVAGNIYGCVLLNGQQRSRRGRGGGGWGLGREEVCKIVEDDELDERRMNSPGNALSFRLNKRKPSLPESQCLSDQLNPPQPCFRRDPFGETWGPVISRLSRDFLKCRYESEVGCYVQYIQFT